MDTNCPETLGGTSQDFRVKLPGDISREHDATIGNTNDTSSQIIYETGQDVWVKSPDDSREHAATVVVASATDVSVLWTHSGRKETVNVAAVRPMFASGSWKRTSTSTIEGPDIKSRKVEPNAPPHGRLDSKDEAIAKLRAALAFANQLVAVQQNEIRGLKWNELAQHVAFNELRVKYKFQTDKILDLEEEVEAKETEIERIRNKHQTNETLDLEEEVEAKGPGIKGGSNNCQTNRGADADLEEKVEAQQAEIERLKLRYEIQTNRAVDYEKKVEAKDIEIKRLRWKYEFQADEILDLEEELAELEKDKKDQMFHIYSAESSFETELKRLKVREEICTDQSLKTKSKLEYSVNEIKRLKTRLTNKSEKMKLANKKLESIRNQHDEQKDQIARLECEVRRQQFEIIKLTKDVKIANDKVCDRDEEISKLKGPLKNLGDGKEEKNGRVDDQIERRHVSLDDQTRSRKSETSHSTPQKKGVPSLSRQPVYFDVFQVQKVHTSELAS